MNAYLTYWYLIIYPPPEDSIQGWTVRISIRFRKKHYCILVISTKVHIIFQTLLLVSNYSIDGFCFLSMSYSKSKRPISLSRSKSDWNNLS